MHLGRRYDGKLDIRQNAEANDEDDDNMTSTVAVAVGFPLTPIV